MRLYAGAWLVPDGRDIFDLYRQLLTILVGSYVLVRTFNFVAWVVAYTGASGVGTTWRHAEDVLRKYVVVQLRRLRPGRFTLGLVQIGLLAAVLFYLLWVHWHW